MPETTAASRHADILDPDVYVGGVPHATFARLRADGAEYARYDGLYIVENRDGFWGITTRSTFAP